MVTRHLASVSFGSNIYLSNLRDFMWLTVVFILITSDVPKVLRPLWFHDDREFQNKRDSKPNIVVFL